MLAYLTLYDTEACPVNSVKHTPYSSLLTEFFLKYLMLCLKTRTKITVNASRYGLIRSRSLLVRVNITYDIVHQKALQSVN